MWTGNDRPCRCLTTSAPRSRLRLIGAAATARRRCAFAVSTVCCSYRRVPDARIQQQSHVVLLGMGERSREREADDLLEVGDGLGAVEDLDGGHAHGLRGL